MTAVTDKLVLVDVDDTLCDFLGTLLSRHCAATGERVEREDIQGWDLTQSLSATEEEIIRYYDCPTFYDDVVPFDGAVEEITKLREDGYRVVFVTSSTAEGAKQKKLWLKRHGLLPSDRAICRDFISASDKDLIAPDAVLVDDGLHNIKNRKKAVLYSQPHNRGHVTMWRADTWEHVGLLVRALARERYDLL